MRRFLLGLTLGALLAPAACLTFALTGRMQVTAGTEPPGWEKELASFVLRKSIRRQAPEQKNPIASTEESLLAGMKLFVDGCAGCHGTASKKSLWGTGNFYPRVPQFGFVPTELTEAQIFWVIKNGIRYSGMGGNGGEGGYPDEKIWKMAGFLSRLKSLPPRVEAEWQKATP